MTKTPEWWRKPRRIAVVVDNPSWVLPYAERLVASLAAGGDDCHLYRDYAEMQPGSIALFLGCIGIAPAAALKANHRNLVAHASPLPKGRGFSPLTWQILEGENTIPVCLLEAAAEVDSGPIVDREDIVYEGHELIEELRAGIAEAALRLFRRFLEADQPQAGTPQQGPAQIYARRRPEDSRLNPLKPIADQFNLLRVVDNDRYPAFFDLHGKRYKLSIEKMPDPSETAGRKP